MSKYHILDEEKLKEVLYHDYLLIKQMNVPLEIKIKLLSTLFTVNPNCWRVIGITPKALEIFAEYNFKKISGMGINRSHIIQRHDNYKIMLEGKISNTTDFWENYFNNDATILSTSSENMSASKSFIDEALLIPNDERQLFRSLGYAWKHKKEEEDFLKNLYIQYSKQ
ncbi:hypothetical protein V7S78_09435 [Aquirufa regiilacus]